MEIENEVREVIKYFSGIKSSLPHGLTQANDAEEMTNFVPRRGRLRKIWGTTLKFNSGAGTGPIQWISRLANRWLAQHGNAILREQTEGQYDFQQQGEIALGDANRARSAKWENRIFLANGVDCKYVDYNPIDGFTYRNVGLLPPGGGIKPSPTPYLVLTNLVTVTEVAASGSGLAVPNGYIYTFTFWDERTQTESLPYGAFVSEDGLWQADALFAGGGLGYLLINASKALRVNISQQKALGYDTQRTTHFILYRSTLADIEVFKRCFITVDGTLTDKIPIANDYADDETAEADLGTVLDLSLSPPPSGHYYREDTAPGDTNPSSYGPRFVEFFRDQLWMFGVRFPGTIYGMEPGYRSSDTNQYPYSGFGTGSPIEELRFNPQTGIAYASDVGNPDYWLYTYDIGKSTGQEDTGIAKFDDILMFFKSRSSYRLLGSSPENYEIRDMDPNRGISFSGSLAATTIGVIGLSAEGFVLFSGGKGMLIADELFDLVARVNTEYTDLIAATFDPVEEKYECSLPLDEFTHNSHVFSFDCKTKSWALTRKRFGAAAYEELGNNTVAGLLGDAQNGRLYDASNTLTMTLNGQTMHGSWRSGAFDCGAPGKLKSVQIVEITARALRDFRLSIALIPDFGQGDAVQVNDINPDVRDDNWAADENDTDGMTWDHGQWGKASRKKRFTVLIQGLGKNFNLIIKNSDTDADRANFEIEEVIVRASLLGGDRS